MKIVGLQKIRLRAWQPLDAVVAVLTLLASSLVYPSNALAQGTLVKGEIQRRADTTNIEFRGLSRWPYEIRKASTKTYSLILPAFDEATVAALQTWSDGLITSIKINKDGPDGNYEVVFSTADDGVESFNYLTDEPSRLIIDFYKTTPVAAAPQEDPKKPERASSSKSKKATRGSRTAAEVKDAEGYKKSDRRPAGDERIAVKASADPETPQSVALSGGAYDAADPEFKRFQILDYEIKNDAIIASEKNIYIDFPMLKMPVSKTQEFVANLPEYEILPKDTRENKEARLLLSLYKRQMSSEEPRRRDRIGAFLKVYEHFKWAYPQSEYNEIVHNMAAHIHYLRYQKSKDVRDYDNHIDGLKYLIAKYPDSILTERNRLRAAYAALDRGDALKVIQEFQDYLGQFPKSEYVDDARKALADGFIILHKYDDAMAMYKTLEKEGGSPLTRAESLYRQGDVYFSQKKYKDAIKTYQSALEKYPELEATFPNARYNLGEAYFWERNFRASLDNHVKFLKLHPNHPYGGYAMTRAGEALEALGADRSKVMGAFLESYYRYQDNPGSQIARVRMLSQQMKGMKDKELRKAVDEINRLARTSPLPSVNEFTALMVADGFQRRGENQAAIDRLVAFYQANSTSPKLDLFHLRILRNISERLASLIDQGKFGAALAEYSQYSKTWLANADRIDVQFFVGMAYEQAGVFKEAKKVFEQALQSRLKISGTREELERRVSEILPTPESLRLRLAAVATDLRDFPGAFEQLKTLRGSSGLSPKESIERQRLMAKIYKEQGRQELAREQLKSLIKAWQGDFSFIKESQLELAELELNMGQANEAERLTDEILQKSIPEESSSGFLARTYELRGDAELAQGKGVEAVETYQKLLKDFESVRRMGPIRYRVGEILFKRGDLVGAEKIWMALDENKYSTLKRLAVEKLEGARWQVDNKKYIQRIPAMQGFKEE